MKISLTILFLFFTQVIFSQCELGNEHIRIYSQTELENFFTVNSECEEIFSIIIEDTPGSLDPIVDLSPMSNIKRIESGILLRDCSKLQDLEGLDNLRKISLLSIRGATSLVDLSALYNLDSLRFLNFEFNEFISDTEQIQSIGLPREGLSLDGNCNIGELKISADNYRLEILNNQLPNNFYNVFTYQPDTLLLQIRSCSNISFQGFKNFDQIDEVWINTCENCSFDGFQNLVEIRNLVLGRIGYSSDPAEYPFSKLERTNYLSLWSIKRIKDFSKYFPKIKSISGRLALINNDSLYHISVLNNIPIPTKEISTNINTNSFDLLNHERVFFYYNPNLDYCSNDFICEALTTYPDSVFIEGNGTESCQYYGLLSYCTYVHEGNITLPSGETETLHAVCPNPADSYITIDIEYEYSGTYNYIIFDMLGNIVNEGELNKRPINIESLGSGNYFISVYDSENKQVKQVRFNKI